MKKYIIKNCPNYWYINRAIPECGLTYKVSGFKGETETSEYCKDITDCLLKQIVEKCKKGLNFLSYGIPEQHLETMVTNAERYAKAEMAQDILSLLEIEEVE